jgi:glycosyltransferase involved in cell wall biosynthesis
MAAGSKVRALPDPVVVVPSAGTGSAVGADLQDALRGDLPVFTLFGAISERKGALRVLEALAQLSARELAGLRVVMAGRIEPDIAGEVAERSRVLAAAGGQAACLRIIDRYLTTAELAWLVQQSSVLLAPYQRFVGSSGVLTWAADARKPVIAQSYGLVGALVRDYRLGLAVDTTDPARIAEALRSMARPDQVGRAAAAARWDAFCTGRSPDEFAAAVFAGLPVVAGRAT